MALLPLSLWSIGLGALFFVATPASAHHGVAGVGAAALAGPGAPIESASSAVLPKGSTLALAKLDHARFKHGDGRDTEADYNQYWMLGLGHGFASWFSGYVFFPYNKKVDTAEPPGAATPRFNTYGWADVILMGQIGFTHEPGQGLRLTPEHESLDDLEDWRFTLFAGATVPTGKANLKNRNGEIDPGKSTSFGEPSTMYGITASKLLDPNTTFNLEASLNRFRTHRYAPDSANPDGLTMRFGAERRLNLSVVRRLHFDTDQRLRLDGVLEAQWLELARDVENGIAAEATGGKILYLTLGLRLFYDRSSVAFGVKKPVWTRLNESEAQQGAEGKEKYRLLFTASWLF